MPALVLDRAPLPTDASIRNFQQGKVGYVANVVEQALLLLEDMADLRSLRKYEVFLSLKRDLALVSLLTTFLSFYHSTNLFYTCTYTLLILLLHFFFLKAVQAAHRAEEIVISSHKAMKEEEGRSVVTVKALELAKKKSQDLNAKLVEVDRDKKRAETALDEVERQVKAQCKQVRQVEDKLSAARSQIKVLTKKLKEAEKAKEQDRYNVGVVEIEEALRAEVSEVYRFYHLQVWNEALNQAGVESSSTLKRAENVYYPLAIHASSSLGSKANSISKEANEGKESSAKALPTANISPEAAEQSEDAKKVADTTKEVAYNAYLPPSAPQGERGFLQHGDCAGNSPHTIQGIPQR